MKTSIHEFRIPLGLRGDKFSQEELEARKAAGRSELKILIPASSNLIHSEIKEYMEFRNGQFFLVFELIEASQLTLDFAKTSGGKSKVPLPLAKVNQELSDLQHSAENSQIRIGEIVEIIQSTTNGSTALDVFENLSREEQDLWRYMHKNSGETKSLS